MLDWLKPEDRDLTDAGKTIIGGAFAAIAFEGYRRLFEPLSSLVEYLIGAVVAIFVFLALTYLAAVVFTYLEKEVPQPSVLLEDDALDDIADRLSERKEDEDD